MSTLVNTTAISLCALAGAASAQVTLYTAQVNASYEQIADDTPPETPYAWAFFASVYMVDVADADSASLAFDGPRGTLALPRVRDDLPIFAEFGGYYADRAEFETDFPDGEYVFSIAGGTFGPQSANVTLDRGVMAATVPYFTGDTFTRFHNLDPFQDFAVGVAPFDVPAGATRETTLISIYRTSGSRMLAWEAELAASKTSVVIPAGTLRGGRPYQVAIAYTTARDLPGGFSGGDNTASAAFARGMSFAFDVGCPGDFNGDGQVDFFDYLDFAMVFDALDIEADFNGDSQIDFFDYLDFASAFDRGC